MMLTIHGLPVMVKYHDLKALIKKECNMTDFILDNLVGDLDGYKKVRIGVADETEGSHLTKCLNGYHMGGNVLRVVPIAKTVTNQPQSNFDQRGGFMPNQPSNFGNQSIPMMGNRSAPWGPGAQNQSNQWANQQQQNQMPQNNFSFQQGPNNPQFSQQQQSMAQRGQPAPKPFTQTGSFNRPATAFGSSNNVQVPIQAQRRPERSHVLRNVELVPEPQRPQPTNRFPQDSYEQNKPITINKDYFQGSSQFNESQQVYSQGPGQASSWNKPPLQQKSSQFDKGPQFDDNKRPDKGRFSPPRGPHERRPSAGRDLRSPGRRSPGRRSPGRRPSPGDRRIPSRKSPGRRDSPPKRISPSRRLESPGRRFSPSRRHPDKGYSDRGSQSKQVRPAYEPDGKTPNQAIYSGGYRPSPHESGQYSGRQINQRDSPWQQDRDKNMYPGQMKKQDDERRDSRMPGSSRGPEPLETNRPSPMHKSRSPNRRDVRERSPLRDRYKRHSPSPRSPRRSWALEKRRSPDLNQAPPPPMWPGQNEEESYVRDKAEGSKHVPVWDHRTLAETEEAMRRDNFAYADERMRREAASRDAPSRREPSPRRIGFKPHEERFSPKNNKGPKFEPRDPKFLSRESKFDSRDPKFDPRDPKFDQRDPKFDPRGTKFDHREPKFEPRDPKFDPREPKFEHRDPKFQPRDPKFEPREPKFEPRDPKFEPREPKFEPRDPKFETRDPKFDSRDPKFDSRGPKFEPRDPKFDSRGPKFEPRDPKFDPRGPKFEPRDPKFEPRDPKFEPRDPKFDQRDHKFEPRDYKFDSRDHHFEAGEQRKMGPPQSNLEHRVSRFDQPKMEVPGANYDQRDPKYGSRGPNFEPRDLKFEPRGTNFDLREKYEHREPKFEPRDPKFEQRGPNYDQREHKYDSRGPKVETRDPKFESRELKFEPRDSKFEPRDDKFKPTFEPVDPSFRERDPVKFEVRDPKYSSRDKFDTRARNFESREDYKDRREYLDDDVLDRNNRPDRDNRDYQRPDDRHYRDEPGRREEFPRRDDRKDSRQPQDEFQKEFEDIFKRSHEFKQKVQELRRSDRERGDYAREDRRREPERDDRRKLDDDDHHRDMERHHDDRSRNRSRSPHDEDRMRPVEDIRRIMMSRKILPPEVKLKRDKAVENITSKMMEKYGNFEMDSVMKLRVKEDLQVAISRILFDMFGPKDISFIEMVVKFNAKHDQRSELKIFEEVMSCFPSHVYKAMKRSTQDSDRSEIPAKTSKLSVDDDPHLKGGDIMGNQVQISDWNLAFGQQGFIANIPIQPFEGVPQMGMPMNPNPMMVPSPFAPQMNLPENVHIEKEEGFNLYLCKDDFKPFTDIQAELLKKFLVTQIFKVTETSHGWAPEFTLKGLQSMFRYEMHTFDEESKNWLLNFDFGEFKLFSVLVYTKEELWYERAAIWLPGHSGCRHIEPLDKLKLQNKKLEDVCVGKWKLVKKIVNPKGTRIYVDMPPSSARALDKHKMLLSYELQKVNVFLKQIAIDKDAFDAGLQEMSTKDQSVIVAAAKSSPMPVLKEDANIVKITLKGSKSLSIEQVRKIKEMVIYHMFKYHQQNGPSKTDFIRYGYCPPNSLGLLPENQESKRWLSSIDIGRLHRQPIVIVGGDTTATRYLKLFLTVPGDHNCNAAIVAERLKQSNQGVKGINFHLWRPLQVMNEKSKFKFEVEIDLESAETLSKMKFQLDYVDDRHHTKIVQFKPESSVARFTELIEKYKAELTDSYDVANMDLASSESEDDIVCLSE